MSELPISSPYRSTPDAPVGDQLRDQLNDRLNLAFTEGKIDADDFRERLDLLFAAQRMGELMPVVTGLPAAQTYADPAIVASGGGQPGELAESRNAGRAALVAGAVIIGAIVLIVLLLAILL